MAHQGLASPALTERTTYKLIRPIEVVALLLQGTSIMTSLLNDPYREPQRHIMEALCVLHFGLALLCLRYRGPLTRGGTWPAVWVAAMLVMPLVVASLIAPADYASGGYGVQMGTYQMLALAVFAFHPWWRRLSRPALRWAVKAALVTVVVVEPLLIAAWMWRWDVSTDQLKSVSMYAIWTVAWYLVGEGVNALCRIAVAVESEALLKSYNEALDGFHTYVEAAYMRLKAGHNLRDVASELNRVIYERRRLLLLDAPRVSVAAIFKNATRLFGDELRVTYRGPGPVTVYQDVAMVLERGLMDLLKNVVAHGGGEAEVTLEVRDETAALTVRDFGPGFAAGELEVATSNLHQLRDSARRLGGDLVKPPSDVGAVLRLTLQLQLQQGG
jgi:hypothetical protein